MCCSFTVLLFTVFPHTQHFTVSSSVHKHKERRNKTEVLKTGTVEAEGKENHRQRWGTDHWPIDKEVK